LFFRGTEKIHHLACFWHWPFAKFQVLSIDNNSPSTNSLCLSQPSIPPFQTTSIFWSLKLFFSFVFFLERVKILFQLLKPQLAKAAALRVTLNLDGAPIASHSHTHPSHSQTSRLLTLSLSLGVPVPRPTQCM
jgi:hypothetical protein